MKRALITGSAGFVGRHMRAELIRRGYMVDEVDTNHKNRYWARDVRNYFHDTKTGFSYDLVVHLAAVVGGRQMIEGDPLALAVDLEIDAAAIRWAVRNRPRRFVYFSSSAAYPIRLQTHKKYYRLHESDIDLDRIETPDMTYGWAKLTGEMLIRHAQSYGVNFTILRPFSGYGEDQSTDYPFPSIIDRVLRRENPLTVWGTGAQARDWIHISDIIGATLAAVDNDIPGPINLGWGKVTRFYELAEMASIAAGYVPDIQNLIDKPEGVEFRVSNSDLMHSFYTPQVSLEQGIEMALKSRHDEY